MDGAVAGSSKKATIYVGGFAPDVNEQHLLDTFVTFGEILDISIPTEPYEPSKHRGYAFLTFTNPADAQDAIDNYDLNELPGYQGQGKFLKCNVAQPNKYGNEGQGDKFDRPVWESEAWLQKFAKSTEDPGDQGQAPPAQKNGDDEDD